MQAASRFSYEQMQTLSNVALGFLSDSIFPGTLEQGYHGWRTIAALSPPNQQTVMAGRAIRLGQLTRAEQQAFYRLLLEMARYPRYPPLDLEVGPGQLPAALLTLQETRIGDLKQLDLRLDGAPHPLCQWPLRVRWGVTPERQP